MTQRTFRCSFFFCKFILRLRNQRRWSIVFTHQIIPVIISFFATSCTAWQMYHLINTFELVLSVAGVFACVWFFACLAKSLAAVQWEKCRKLCSPPTIPISTSSAWIPSELNPWPFPCPWAWVLPFCCRPSSWVHADLWTLPRLWGTATDPVHRLHRRQEHKMESCPSSQVPPEGVAYCEKLTPASDCYSKVTAAALRCWQPVDRHCEQIFSKQTPVTLDWSNFLS